MNTADRLSNDAILGLDIDSNINTNYPGIDIISNNNNNSSNTSQTRKRKGDRLTSIELLSGRGIPKLQEEFKKFKFISKRDNHNKNKHKLLRSNNVNYGESHHYENLSRILQVYQSWGHQLTPHLKFDRFIDNLSRSIEDTDTKHWLRDQICEEMRLKMEKENNIDQAPTNTSNISNTLLPVSNAPIENFQQEEDNWPELFGREPNTTTNGIPTQNNTNTNTNINNNTNANVTANADIDVDIDITQYKQTSLFSVVQHTSSQQLPSEDIPEDVLNEDNENDAYDALNDVDDGLQDILSDDEYKGNNNDKVDESQVMFSQYLASDSQLQSQPQSQIQEESQNISTTVEHNTSPVPPSSPQPPSDDEFSDDDAVFAAI